MDVARFRSAASRLTRVVGFASPVPIRPLTRGEMIAIDDAIDQRLGAHLHCARRLAAQLAVLELATGCPDVGQLPEADVAALFAAWELVQDASNPDVEQLSAEAELQLIESRGFLISDAQAAANSTSPADFYGRAVCDLTDGQLAYYLVLRRAHGRWSEKQCKTVAALRVLARRSGTTRARGAES